MVVVQSAQIPERVAQKTVLKLLQTKNGIRFTNIIGVSLRTIKIFGSCSWLKQQRLSDQEKRPPEKNKDLSQQEQTENKILNRYKIRYTATRIKYFPTRIKSRNFLSTSHTRESAKMTFIMKILS